MTTDDAGGSEQRAVAAVLGPWALLPAVSGIVIGTGAIVQGLSLSAVTTVPVCRFTCTQIPWVFAPGLLSAGGDTSLPSIDPVALALTGALCGLVAWAMLAVIRYRLRLAPTDVPSRTDYLLAMTAAGIAAAAVRVVLLTPLESDQAVQAIISTATRFVIVLAFVHSVIGLITDRHARAQARAEAALGTVRRQQTLIVGSDERARREVADFLHDRVQARLLVVAMQIQAASADARGGSAELLNDAIHELERIRNDDVRAAGRRLSPDLRSVGLDTALAELAGSWSSAMTVDISIDAAARRYLLAPEVSGDLLTALYRTAEQALLNSAAHGHADQVAVRIRLDSAGLLQLTVRDDGIGFTTFAPGSGSAVIDAWLSVVDGSWSISHVDGEGTVLMATMPA